MSLILYAGNSEIINESNFDDIREIELQLNPEISEVGFNDTLRNRENIILTRLPLSLEKITISIVLENVKNVENLDSYYMFNNLPTNLKFISIVVMRYNLNNKKNDINLLRKKITTSVNFKVPFNCRVHFVGF